MPKVIISFIVASKGRPGPFVLFLKSVNKTCNGNYKSIEIIVKVDYPNIKKKYIKILKKTPFNHKVICDNIRGYHNIYKMQNKMCKIAHGDIYWAVGDDVILVGHWFEELQSARNKYKDNICVINTDSDWTTCPAISKEWFLVFGHMSPVPAADTWLRDLAIRIGRYITVPTARASYQFPNKMTGKKTHHRKKMRLKMKRMLPKAAVKIQRCLINCKT